MKIITWNVNGIRATIKNGFLDVIKQEDPDILCLQEVKAYESQIPPEIRFVLQDYNFVRNAAKKPGYAGTATFFKKNIPLLGNILFEDNLLFSGDGRVIETKFTYDTMNVSLFNVYFPNGNPKDGGQEMLSSKLQFYDEFLQYIDVLKNKGTCVICAGDFNVAHKEIDLDNPRQNKKSIGFLPVEREKIDMMIDHGFTDVLRYYYPDKVGCYTRWTYRKGFKEANKGWRYDYFFVSPNAMSSILEMTHLDHVRASDHCPLCLLLK